MNTLHEQPNNHFYLSSVAAWVVSTPERDLRDCIKMMEKDGFGYSIWFVPHPHDTPYQIKFYAPQIEGAVWCGFFEKKGGRKRAARVTK